MIGRIRERHEFQALSRHGRRARTDALWCRYLDDPRAVPPRVGFAIGRSVGPAVVRNRLRRRLRAIVARAAADPAAGFDHGLLLIGAQPSVVERSFDEVSDAVTAMLAVVLSPADHP